LASSTNGTVGSSSGDQSSLGGSVSTAFTPAVAPAVVTPTHYEVIGNFPTQVTANSPFGFQFAAMDDNGNIDTSYFSTADMFIGNKTTLHGVILSGPGSVPISVAGDHGVNKIVVSVQNGIGSVSGLKINLAQTGYDLGIFDEFNFPFGG